LALGKTVYIQLRSCNPTESINIISGKILVLKVFCFFSCWITDKLSNTEPVYQVIQQTTRIICSNLYVVRDIKIFCLYGRVFGEVSSITSATSMSGTTKVLAYQAALMNPLATQSVTRSGWTPKLMRSC